jgi:hypothetical protein
MYDSRIDTEDYNIFFLWLYKYFTFVNFGSTAFIAAMWTKNSVWSTLEFDPGLLLTAGFDTI